MKTFLTIRSNTGGGTVSPPVGQGQSPVGIQGAKPQEARKSLHSTLPEVVKKSTLIEHFFHVLHLKVTEKIIKIHNKVQTFPNQCTIGRLHSLTKLIKVY